MVTFKERRVGGVCAGALVTVSVTGFACWRLLQAPEYSVPKFPCSIPVLCEDVRTCESQFGLHPSKQIFDNTPRIVQKIGGEYNYLLRKSEKEGGGSHNSNTAIVNYNISQEMRKRGLDYKNWVDDGELARLSGHQDKNSSQCLASDRTYKSKISILLVKTFGWLGSIGFVLYAISGQVLNVLRQVPYVKKFFI